MNSKSKNGRGSTSDQRDIRPRDAGFEEAVRKGLANAAQDISHGRLARADAICARILEYVPHQHEAWRLRGLIACQSHKLDLAADYLTRSLAAEPDNAQAHCDLGMVYHAMGRHDQALDELAEAVRRAPALAVAYFHLGNVHSARGSFDKAAEAYRLALQYRPDLDAARPPLVRALLRLGRAHDALTAARQIVSRSPDSAVAHTVLAEALDWMGRFAEAKDAHERAIALNPNDPQLQMGLAQTLASYGRIAEAAECCRGLLKARPDFVPAHTLLANLTRHTERDREVQALERLQGRTDLPLEQRVQLGFSLGKVLEELGEYSAAFDAVARANKTLHGTLRYSREQTEMLFADIQKAFTADLFERLNPVDSPRTPSIFVVGMPRSGTTLVEQLISTHADATGVGEVQLVERISKNLRREVGQSSYVDALPRIDADRLARAGAEYLSDVQRQSGVETVTVDKVPANFLYLGLIRLMLPNARIVHCRRNALDTCWSIFKNRFAAGSLHFAYDLEDIAHYFRLYSQLMAHWQKTLPSGFFDVEYESLIADQQGETRRLLAYCGLRESETTGDFFAGDRPVHTASIAQVREPLHSRSVGISARYGAALDPLRRALGDLVAKQAQP